MVIVAVLLVGKSPGKKIHSKCDRVYRLRTVYVQGVCRLTLINQLEPDVVFKHRGCLIQIALLRDTNVVATTFSAESECDGAFRIDSFLPLRW
jgi:hypothetical protein